jgi:leucyl aminopeptidase
MPMHITAKSGRIQEQDVGAIVAGALEESTLQGALQSLDAALGGALRDLVDSGDLSGAVGEVVTLYPHGAIPAQRLILVGLGPREDLSLDTHRRAAARALQKARELKAHHVAYLLEGDETTALAQAVSEGALLGLYEYRGQKSGPNPEVYPEHLDLIIQEGEELSGAQQGVSTGQAIAAGVSLTRDLVNLPPNICTPLYMAETAVKTAETVGLRYEALNREQMEALGMGALLGVARGSDTPPRLIILEHNAGRADELDTIVLVGKGVTFDTGGYNLKSSESMSRMKGDMAGAGAVIGAMRAIGALDLPLHVVGLAPTSDNMISGHAYRPQEVVTASNGTTIEIISTDAEGRMLLADALVYASRFNPSAVVDIATLTGTCAAALGRVAAGLFSTDDAVRESLLAAAAATYEKLWPLPLFPEYEKAIKSDTADIKNSGGRTGGIGASAMFLKHFVDYPAWAHIDMAGLAFEAQDNPYVPGKGATGYGVRLLTQFVRGWGR